MSQVTEQSVRFQTALASIKLIQASAVLDLTEDDFDFLTSNKVWIATDRSRARRCVEACVYGALDFVGYPRFPAPVEFIAAVIAYYVHPVNIQTACLIMRSEERFSRNAETDLVCRLLLEKKKKPEFHQLTWFSHYNSLLYIVTTARSSTRMYSSRMSRR